MMNCDQTRGSRPRSGIGRRSLLLGAATGALAPAALIIGSEPSSAGQSLAESVASALPAVVTIEVLVPEPHHPGGVRADAPQMALRWTNGSGFFLDPSGLVLTNAHVVIDAVEMTVVTHDNRRWPAALVDYDRLTDLAFLSIDGPIPAVLPVHPVLPEIGSPVMAIGAPSGFSGSVSTGIVAGRARSVRLAAPGILLQHTAAISAGSSGGPVLDPAGRVIGVNTAVPDGHYGFTGISLAVDGPTTIPVIDQLRRPGGLRRPDLGMTLRAADPLLARALGPLPVGAALVQDVTPDGAAARAGVLPGDHLVSIDGVQTPTVSVFLRWLALRFGAEPLTLGLLRQGQSIRVGVTPGLDRLGHSRPPAGTEPLQPGLTVTDDGHAVIVSDVAPGAAAASIGIEPGDRIHWVNLRPVRDAAAARQAIAEGGDVVALGMSRAGGDVRWILLGAAQSASGTVVGNHQGPYSIRI